MIIIRIRPKFVNKIETMEYRLNKYISDSGYCSRREADKYIENGQVIVNGKKAEIGDRVELGQVVKVNGHLIDPVIEPVYIALNKPVGIVCTTDPTESNNIVDFVSHEQRVFPIGRLDKDSQGLILLTNNGDIVNKILRADNNHKKVYVVSVNKPITELFLTKMSQGVPILDRVTRKCELEQINPYTFKISLIQGLNRQIRRMCEYLGYEVLKLERIQVMNIKLDKLGQGNWRDLTAEELKVLFRTIEDSKKTSSLGRSTASINIGSKKSIPAKAEKPKTSGVPYNKSMATPSETNSSEKSKAKPKSPKPKKENGLSGPREGKSRVKSIKTKQKRWY